MIEYFNTFYSFLLPPIEKWPINILRQVLSDEKSKVVEFNSVVNQKGEGCWAHRTKIQWTFCF